MSSPLSNLTDILMLGLATKSATGIFPPYFGSFQGFSDHKIKYRGQSNLTEYIF